MRRLDIFGAFEVGDGAGDFEHAAVGADYSGQVTIKISDISRFSATL